MTPAVPSADHVPITGVNAPRYSREFAQEVERGLRYELFEGLAIAAGKRGAYQRFAATGQRDEGSPTGLASLPPPGPAMPVVASA